MFGFLKSQIPDFPVRMYGFWVAPHSEPCFETKLKNKTEKNSFINIPFDVLMSPENPEKYWENLLTFFLVFLEFYKHSTAFFTQNITHLFNNFFRLTKYERKSKKTKVALFKSSF